MFLLMCREMQHRLVTRIRTLCVLQVLLAAHVVTSASTNLITHPSVVYLYVTLDERYVRHPRAPPEYSGTGLDV